VTRLADLYRLLLLFCCFEKAHKIVWRCACTSRRAYVIDIRNVYGVPSTDINYRPSNHRISDRYWRRSQMIGAVGRTPRTSWHRSALLRRKTIRYDTTASIVDARRRKLARDQTDCCCLLFDTRTWIRFTGSRSHGCLLATTATSRSDCIVAAQQPSDRRPSSIKLQHFEDISSRWQLGFL